MRSPNICLHTRSYSRISCAFSFLWNNISKKINYQIKHCVTHPYLYPEGTAIVRSYILFQKRAFSSTPVSHCLFNRVSALSPSTRTSSALQHCFGRNKTSRILKAIVRHLSVLYITSLINPIKNTQVI
jgi:hypothetical protein